MLTKQSSIPLWHCVIHPFLGCFFRIDTHIRLRFFKIRIKVRFIISISRNIKHNFIRTFHRQFSICIRQGSAFCLRLNTNDIFHSVIVQRRGIHQSFITVRSHIPGRHRIRRITENQVLFTRLIRTETHHHHIGWIRNEIIALISHMILFKLNNCHCRV